jgi:serine/threonine protein kinase
MDGGSLGRKFGREPQPVWAAARLVETLARAAHHTHTRGVIHRDLKPANVLLAADGTPKIADFGIAKCVEGGSGQTHTGAILGTPSYMAPEQAEGNSKQVGPAADVYALGAILYEVLTGRPPFLADSAVKTLMLVATQPPMPPRQLRPEVPAELEAVCLRCLRKAPAERYPTAAALADDLRRWLDGQPTESAAVPAERPPRRPRAIRLRLWTSWLRISITVSFGLLLAIGLWLGDRPDPALRHEADLPPAQPSVEVAAVKPPEPKPPEPKPPAPAPPPEPRTIPVVPAGLQVRSIATASGPVRALALSPDERTAAVAADGSFVRTYDLLSASSHSSASTHRSQPTAVAFGPTSRVLVYGGADGSVRAHDFDTDRDAAMLAAHTKPVAAVAVAALAQTVLSGGDDGARLWDLRTGRQVWPPPARDGRVSAVAITANGQTLYAVTNGALTARNPRNGWVVKKYGKEADAMKSLALSADGQTAVCGTADGRVLVWDLKADKSKELAGHAGEVGAVAISADGKRALSGGADKTVRLWDLVGLKELGRFEGHAGEVVGVALAPDGKQGVSGGADGTVWVLNLSAMAAEGP